MERDYNELDGMDLAEARVNAAFELMEKLGMEYFCFHDLDIAPEGNSLQEKLDNLDKVVEVDRSKNERNRNQMFMGNNKCLQPSSIYAWASTSPNADVFAFAAAQVKKALEITNRLNGENYVFWGGREGYETLLNTDVALENDKLSEILKNGKRLCQKNRI